MEEEEKGNGCKATFWVIVVVLFVFGFSLLGVNDAEHHKQLDRITEFECMSRGLEFGGHQYLSTIKERVGYCVGINGDYQFVKIE